MENPLFLFTTFPIEESYLTFIGSLRLSVLYEPFDSALSNYSMRRLPTLGVLSEAPNVLVPYLLHAQYRETGSPCSRG